MIPSPFAFFRGAAAIMAADLAHTPPTGIRVQVCGDAHLMNFGAFATPERRVIFDINDFDETLPAPWEWDIKRLATSFLIGKGDQFDKAVADFATAYAKQNERDYKALVRAAQRGHIEVYTES
jgi:uncharacterized protein (DUF2252 family)